MPRKDQGGVVNLLGKMSATPSGSVEPADPKGLSSLGPQVPPDAVCPRGLHVSVVVGHMAEH